MKSYTIDAAVMERVREALQDCLNDVDGCEINMSNYGPDEVAGINNAYIQLFGAVEDAIKALSLLDSAQGQEAEGWRDISSAPRDGTVILCADDRNPKNISAVFWASGQWKYSTPRCEISHWKPIDAPKTADSKEG